jgi:hypothetical protein
MWLAEQLGYVGPLSALMDLIPRREYMAWMVRKQKHEEEPDLVCKYIVQLSNEVRGIFGGAVKSLEDLYLRFKLVDLDDDPTDKSEEYVKDRMAQRRMQAERARTGLA